MIWLYILIIVCIAGLVTIFLKYLKKTNQLERMKTHVNEEHKEQEKLKAEIEKQEKAALDFKEISKIFSKAELLHAQGNIEDAKKAYIHVLSLNPDHIDSNVKLAKIYLNDGAFAKAEELYVKVLTMQPKRSEFYNPLAKALYGQKKLDEAKEAYEAAIKMNKTDKDSMVNLGHIHVETNDYRSAINAFSKALTVDSKLYNLYFLMADLMIKLGAFEEAGACMEALLDIQPYNEEAKELLREIKVKRGDNPLSTGATKNVFAGNPEPLPIKTTPKPEIKKVTPKKTQAKKKVESKKIVNKKQDDEPTVEQQSLF